MTSEELQTMLDAHDAEGCIALFARVTEAERRAVAKTAVAQLKAVTADVPGRFTKLISTLSDEQFQSLLPAAASHRGGLRAAQVAVLATATLGGLKKLGERCLPPIDDVIAVLAARRPPWVGDWAEAILSWSGAGQSPLDLAEHWRFVRRLVREGLCTRPRGSRYIHGMIMAISSFHLGRNIREELLDDPGLLDDEVWEVFETEPLPGMLTLIPANPSTSSPLSWEFVLADFADEGRLSRARLLDASLAGLERDFHEARARWFALMHETLRPTVDERAERGGRYLGLAASHNPSTVTFSIRALASLVEDPRLEPGSLIDAVGPALLARAKGTVQAVLTLIDLAARRDPDLRSRAAVVAVDALSHESPVIHETVLDLIQRHGDPADCGLADLLRERSRTVASSQRARLESWLGPGHPVEGPEPAGTGIDDLLMRVGALEPWIAERAGVAAAVAVLKQEGGEFSAVNFAETEAPRLDPERVIVPVADVDELIGLFSAVLEDPGNPDDLERILDGVSRLCDQSPSDFTARTGPLRVRSDQLRFMFADVTPILSGLALGWITGQPQDLKYAGLNEYLAGIFARHVLAITRRVIERQAAPLLSAPTHQGGWIDPRVLVERVRVWESLPFRSDRLDGALALLRLAPDPGPRAVALQSAAGLEGHYAAALRHALGGDEETVGPDARIWVAAARARSPRDDDPHVEARHPGLGPDAGRAARYSLRPGPHPVHDWHQRRRYPLVARDPALPSQVFHDLPSVLMHDMEAYRAAGGSGWVATIWPLGRDSFFAAGSELLLGFECSPSEARCLRPFLEALLDPDVPLRPMARFLLAGALSANIPELQGLATDALIAAVDDGRIDGQLLGEAIDRLLTDGLAKPVRLAKALGDTARVSPLHTRVVAHALQQTVFGLRPPPRYLHVFLELLKELLVEIGEGVSVPGAEVYLRGLKISGKTAKLARDILGLAAGFVPSSRHSAAARALAGRVERAERWMRCCHQSPV